MIYTESDIRRKFGANLSLFKSTLSVLPMAGGQAPKVNGLNGWVFEQTLKTFLQQELAAEGLLPEIKEQEPLSGKARLDLLVGQTAVELKVAGLFSADLNRYAKYRLLAEGKGWRYSYLSLDETHRPYREACLRTFGADQCFFMDEPGTWRRFIALVKRGLPVVQLSPQAQLDEATGKLELHEILMLFALRFDGWKYAEAVAATWGITQENFYPLLTVPAIESISFPEDPVACMATYFALQRYLGKWGGDMLPENAPAHLIYRMLFLHTYRMDVPLEYRSRVNGWYDQWEMSYAHRREECAAIVRGRFIHDVNGIPELSPR